MKNPEARARDYLTLALVVIGYILLISAVSYTDSHGDHTKGAQGTPTVYPPSY